MSNAGLQFHPKHEDTVMRAISGAIVLLAGVVLFAAGFSIPSMGDRSTIISLGLVIALIGLGAWGFGYVVGDKRAT